MSKNLHSLAKNIYKLAPVSSIFLFEHFPNRRTFFSPQGGTKIKIITFWTKNLAEIFELSDELLRTIERARCILRSFSRFQARPNLFTKNLSKFKPKPMPTFRTQWWACMGNWLGPVYSQEIIQNFRPGWCLR